MEKENYIQAKQFLHNTLGFTKEELALQIKEAIELTATNLVTKSIDNNTSLEKFIEQSIDKVLEKKIDELFKQTSYSHTNTLKDIVAKKLIEKLSIDIKVNK
jgi:hypothetical protein